MTIEFSSHELLSGYPDSPIKTHDCRKKKNISTTIHYHDNCDPVQHLRVRLVDADANSLEKTSNTEGKVDFHAICDGHATMSAIWADNESSGTLITAATRHLCLEDEVDEVAKLMAAEIDKNSSSSTVRQLAKLWAAETSTLANREGPILQWLQHTGQQINEFYERIVALKDFYSLVTDGAVWDHKQYFTTRHAGYEGWASFGAWHTFHAHEYYYDYWSNAHYGYIGSAIGLPKDVLIYGAALNQLLKFSLEPGSDKAAIEDGIEFFATGTHAPSLSHSLSSGIVKWASKFPSCRRPRSHGRLVVCDNCGIAFQWPTEHRKISSPFSSSRLHPVDKIYKPHKGIDLPVATGTNVMATAGGTVTVSRFSKTAGNFVVIQHEEGYSSRYLHLSELLVQEHDTVEQGQSIGRSGNTGNSSGPHLHFEILRGGSAIDPVPLLPKP